MFNYYTTVKCLWWSVNVKYEDSEPSECDTKYTTTYDIKIFNQSMRKKKKKKEKHQKNAKVKVSCNDEYYKCMSCQLLIIFQIVETILP